MSTVLRGSDNFDTADGGDLDPRMAVAWCNFNGTGTVAIRDQFNVTSITDNSTGNYDANYTTALADANYSVVAGTSAATVPITQSTITATESNFRTFSSTPTPLDADFVGMIVFGGQA